MVLPIDLVLHKASCCPLISYEDKVKDIIYQCIDKFVFR